MFAAIARQLGVLLHAAATAATAPALLLLRLLRRFGGGGRFVEFVFIEQPDPLRLLLLFLGRALRLSTAEGGLHAFRRSHPLQSNEYLFAESSIDRDQIGDESDQH